MLSPVKLSIVPSNSDYLCYEIVMGTSSLNMKSIGMIQDEQRVLFTDVDPVETYWISARVIATEVSDFSVPCRILPAGPISIDCSIYSLAHCHQRSQKTKPILNFFPLIAWKKFCFDQSKDTKYAHGVAFFYN